MVKLAIVIPTVGRESLAGLLDSLAAQTTDDDLIQIWCDNKSKALEIGALVNDIKNYAAGVWRTFLPAEEQGCWGHPLRNIALDILQKSKKRSHIWTIDDDDEASLGALGTIKATLEEHPSCPHIFSMRFGQGHPASGIILWREEPPSLRYGEVGTPMVVAPIGSSRFGLQYAGDFDYISSLQEEFGEAMWHKEVIAEIRP